MDMGNVSTMWFYLLMMLVIVSLESHASSFKFQKVCGNSKAAFSISQSDHVVAQIPEEEFTTVFMKYAEEYVFECKSKNPASTANYIQPEIKFESSDKLNKQSNRLEGNSLAISWKIN